VDAAVSLAKVAEELGVIAAALLAAAAVLAPDVRARAAATGGALALTPVLLVAHIWDTPQFRPIRDRPVLALVGAAVALLLVALAAVLIDRRPVLFPIAAVGVLPFRVPIESGGETALLLVPLYFVIAAAALAFIGRTIAGGREAPEPPPAGRLEWLLLGLVVLYAVQAVYSPGFGKALEQLVFFYVPFALLFALLLRVEWTPPLVMRCFGVLILLALAFSLIGFVEYATRTLLLNPRVIASNQFQDYFRVNSLFFDPNIFGRFLIVVMLAVTSVLLFTRERAEVLRSAVVLAVLWGGLVLTLSQSSLSALLVGLAVLAALKISARWTLALGAAAVVLGLAFVIAFPGAVGLHGKGERSLNGATSGRADLVRGGLHLFADRPLQGFGAGSFATEYRRRRNTTNERAVSASHTIPVTVGAEQGVVGLVLYFALLVAIFARLLPKAAGCVIRSAVVAALAALTFHTWLYAAFLEDPLLWTLLAVGTAFYWRRLRLGDEADTTLARA
jgi:O-antigen ligase